MRLLTLSDLAALPPREWLVPGLVPCDALACLFGAPGTGKTFVALDLALSIACGLREWQGQPLPVWPEGAPGVVYVAGEGIHGIRDRVKAWETHKRLGEAQLAQAPLSFVQHPVNLTKEAAASDFAEAVVQHHQAAATRPVKLVVFDTLARCAVGADENSSQEMGVVVANVDRIRRVLGDGCSVLLVHHSGKSAPTAMRGSSAINGAVDTALALLRPSSSSPSTGDATGFAPLLLRAVKQKDGPCTTVRMGLRPHADSMVVVRPEDAAPIPSPAAPPALLPLQLKQYARTASSVGGDQEAADGATTKRLRR